MKQAEHSFVDDTNLEQGEECDLALKAFDAEGNFLCAGALVRRRSAALAAAVHDCWIADSIECGVGPNVQARGAQLIIDCLFLHHLESAKAADIRQFAVFAGDGTGCHAAAHLAARSRGFTVDSTCADSAESVLLFCGADGPQCYLTEAAELETMSDEQSQQHGEVVRGIVRHLRHVPTRPTLSRLPEMEMSVLRDLRSDDWQPLQTQPPWRNPCFFSSFLTIASVTEALRRGVPIFGAGPSLVLASSLIYWRDPVKESSRRSVDLLIVRLGMAWQILLASRYCQAGWVPRLFGSYCVGGCCYAVGRVLTVRGRRGVGAAVHCGVHFFANLGNLLLLPLVR